MERSAWKGRMDLSRVYTKTSKGILEGNTKSREVTREHGRVLTLIDGKSTAADILEKSTRLSENRLAALLDELAEMGMIRQLDSAVPVDDLGFSSTIIVGESDTESFIEAQVHHERELRRAEAIAAQEKDEERTTLLNEVKADIHAEAEAIKSDLAKRSAREAQDKMQEGFRRAAEVQTRREADIKAKSEAKLRQARKDAEARAQALAEHARKQFAVESKARQEAEARAKALQAEADAKARMEAEKKTRLDAEKKAFAAEKTREAAEIKARKVAEKAASAAEEADAKAHARRVLEVKIQAEEEAQRRADMEARLRETEQSKRRGEEEARALAKASEEQRIAAELENRVKRRVEARTREVEAARERAEAEARAKQEEASRLAQEVEAREQAEAAAKAAQEIEAKLEAERQTQKIAEAQALAEVEAQRKSEEAREAAEREAEIVSAAQAKAEAEQRRMEAEKAAEAARFAAEKRAEEERKAQEARIKAEDEARQRAEAEQHRMEAEKAAEAARLAAEKRAEEERKAKDARIKAEHEARRLAEVERRRIEAEKAKVAEQARLAAAQRANEERARRDAAELAAQIAAEAHAKAEAEQKRIDAAKAQVAEEARLAAEREAEKERLRAELQAEKVAQAEEAVRLEAEAAKRHLAEQQRAEDERLEGEAMALKREQELAAAEAVRVLVDETESRTQNEARQQEEAREAARDRAEKAARAAAAEALHHRRDAEQREEAEEHRMRDEAQSRALAAARGAAIFPFLGSRKRTGVRLSKNFIKLFSYGLLGLLVLAVAILHLVPLNFYIPKLERQLAESIGHRVVVRDLHFSLYPAPHLHLEGVSIGDLADVRVGSARVFPTFKSWYAEDKVIPRIELTSVALSDDSASVLSMGSQRQAKTASIQFEKIRVKDAKLQNRLLDLFTFDADVLMREGSIAKAQIRSADQRITIDITPQNEGFAIQLVATGAVLPFEPRLKFDALKIAAISVPGGMTLTQIDGQLYGGSLSGNAHIEWRDAWVFKSDLGVRQISIEPALAEFTRNIAVTGALEAKIRLAAKSDRLETLFNVPQVQATFRARDGELASIDLVRAIQSARSNGNTGGKTHFNELSGYFQLVNGRYQYQQLKLTTALMSAKGSLDLSAQRNLSGNLVGELRTRNTVLRMPFILSGTLVTPSLKTTAPVVRPPAPATVVSEEEG